MPAVSPTSTLTLPSAARAIAALQAAVGAIAQAPAQNLRRIADTTNRATWYADELLATFDADQAERHDAATAMLLGALRATSAAIKSGVPDPARPAREALALVHAPIPLGQDGDGNGDDLDEVAYLGILVPAAWRAEPAR